MKSLGNQKQLTLASRRHTKRMQSATGKQSGTGSKEYVISLKREGEFRKADCNHMQKIQLGFCASSFSLLWLQMGRVSLLFLKGYLMGFFCSY